MASLCLQHFVRHQSLSLLCSRSNRMCSCSSGIEDTPALISGTDHTTLYQCRKERWADMSIVLWMWWLTVHRASSRGAFVCVFAVQRGRVVHRRVQFASLQIFSALLKKRRDETPPSYRSDHATLEIARAYQLCEVNSFCVSSLRVLNSCTCIDTCL